MKKPIFFPTNAAFRAWLRKNHARETEMYVGLWKKGTGKPVLTWSDLVDEALCFGWIDSRGTSLGAKAWSIRFTPRRPGSNWSAVNIAKMKRLIRAKKMTPAGLRAWDTRTQKKKLRYSYEERHTIRLAPAFRKKLRANRKAAAWFDARPPSYKKHVIFWVMSAKKQETRESRMETFLRKAVRAQHIPPLAAGQKKK